jgi:hypothetical protein
MRLTARIVQVCLVLLCFVAVEASSQGAQAQLEEPIATITYESGEIAIERDGQAAQNHDIGDPIYDDDQITTGVSGTLTLGLHPITKMKGSMRLQENTSLVFRLNNLKGERQNESELVMGSVASKVSRIAGKPGFSVVSGEVACGVRGTEFEVTTSSSGDVLVGCAEGEVSCDSEGSSASAVPGQAVEKLEGIPLAPKSMDASSYAEYRKKWVSDEEAAFVRNAPSAARLILQRYSRLQKELREARARVAEDHDLAKWMDERMKGNEPSEAELQAEARDLKDIHVRLEKARHIDAQMRRVDAMVVELMKAIDRNDASLMGTTIRPGYTIGDFFAHFEETRAKDHKEALELRRAIKLYRRRINRLELREAQEQTAG